MSVFGHGASVSGIIAWCLLCLCLALDSYRHGALRCIRGCKIGGAVYTARAISYSQATTTLGGIPSVCVCGEDMAHLHVHDNQTSCHVTLYSQLGTACCNHGLTMGWVAAGSPPELE